MPYSAVVRQLLGEPRLTLGLDDPEAKLLIDWAVNRASFLHQAGKDGEETEVLHLVRVARQLVVLWCYKNAYSAATQLAATECFESFLPAMDESDDPYFVMSSIIAQMPN